jgi:exo-beta-1,3-glucanase (GH17 family)
VASNLAVTNYAGAVPSAGEAVLVSGKQTVAQRFDERLIVWVNASSSSAPNVVTATETALQSRIQRVQSFTARTKAMTAWPNGSVVEDSKARAYPQPGQAVWTAAHVYGAFGRVLDPTQVERFQLTVEALEASSGQWQAETVRTLDPFEHVLTTLERYDTRWRADGGYNVHHRWIPARGATEGTFRLTYEMRLCDDDVRRWQTEVEVR